MNKKVRNAKTVQGYGIEFKSKLELYCYSYFYQNGITLQYEKTTYEIVSKTKLSPKLEIWLDRKTKGRSDHHLRKQVSKRGLDATKYTPDFMYVTNKHVFIIETKGKANDVYPLKRKLFLQLASCLADSTTKDWYFFEPHSMIEVREMYDIIKSIIDGK